MTWICADCGVEHQQNEPPCRQCGSERFAKLEPKTTSQIEPTTEVQWACKECGRIHQRNNPPCNDCGRMQFERVDGDPPTHANTLGGGGTNNKTLYYVGVVLGVAGVFTMPFFFFLIAMPESIAKMRGTTIQNSFPSGARENPAISGSMLVMGWFGNFLWLCVVLGFILGLFLFAG